MSHIIPYNHPSLVLGNIVDTKVLDVLHQMNDSQRTIDVAQDRVNALIAMKRNIAMTINELLDMDIDVSSLEAKMKEIDKSISEAAYKYLSTKIGNENTLLKLKEKLSKLDTISTIESPVDFVNSKVEYQPLSSESLKLDAQYFSFDTNIQNHSFASVESYIKGNTSDLGENTSHKIAQKATLQLEQQHQNHNIAGTLIITASCTHKNVSMIEPCALDPDKVVQAWNELNPKDRINISTPEELLSSNRNNKVSSEKEMRIISGATYGSSFVGMIHILDSQENNDNVSDDMIKLLNKKMRLGGWIAQNTGGIGVTDTTMDEIQRIIDSRRVNSHITLLTMGVVTSIASNKLKTGLDAVSKVHHTSDDTSIESISTVDSDAKKATNSKKKVKEANLIRKSIISELHKVDSQANETIDINSLMSAFNNYITNVSAQQKVSGVPISFYTKKITKKNIIDIWMNKYEKELLANNSHESK